MPKQYFDEDANPIELLSPEEVIEIQEREKKLAEEKEEMAKQIEEKEKELSGYKEKNYNWKRLRDMTEKEREELSARDKVIFEQQELLQEQYDKLRQNTFDKLINDISGGDKDMRDKIMEQYDRIKDEVTTDDQISKKLEDAYLLVTRENRKMSINRAYNVSGIPPRENKVESEESKSIRGVFRIKDEDVKKYSGNWEPKI